MENENLTQEHACCCSNKKPLIIAISLMILALIAAGLIYYWQNDKMTKVSQSAQTEINKLNNEIESLKSAKISLETDLNEAEEAVATIQECPENNLNLPIVAFGRQGLLTNAEENNLREKLINPFIDYYKDINQTLVSIYILVPENAGEDYLVTAIFNSGSQEFIFGARENDYDYWKPICMDECEFSDEFRAKYPQIVE